MPMLAIIFSLIPLLSLPTIQQTLIDHPDLATHVRTINAWPRADLYWNQPGRIQPPYFASAEAHFNTMTIVLALPLPGDAVLRRLVLHELCHLQGWALYQDPSEVYAETCERSRR